MDKDKQRIAIAEACGWKGFNPDNIPDCIQYTAQRADGKWGMIPDYLNDLNAMHEAVISLPDDKQGNFRRHLEDVIRGRKLGYQKVGISLMGKEEYTRWFNAAASQRAEAFLRTLNLWTPTGEENE